MLGISFTSTPGWRVQKQLFISERAVGKLPLNTKKSRRSRNYCKKNCTTSIAGHVRYVSISGKYTETIIIFNYLPRVSIVEGILSRSRISSTRPSSENNFGYERATEVG